MSVDRNRLLSQIATQLEGTCALKAAALLLDSKTRLVAGAPTHQEVQELLPTLRSHLKITQRTGKLIYGLEQIIVSLETNDPSDVVIGYGFISPSAAGNIYLSRNDEHLLGVTIVDRC